MKEILNLQYWLVFNSENRMIWIKCSWSDGCFGPLLVLRSYGSGSWLPSHLGAEQLEEEGQLAELRLVSEMGS